MRVFVDSLLWIAMARPTDAYRHSALEALAKLGDAELITTEEVLVDAAMVRKLLESETVVVRMYVMGITQILTFDHHSRQEGFAVLLDR